MLRAIRAITAGAALVARAPVLIVLIYIGLLAVVLPAAVVVARSFEDAFTERTVERVWPADVEAPWFERASRATRFATGSTFTPAIVGFAVQLSNIDDLIEGELRESAALVPLIVWAGAWTFLLGGILSRYARPVATAPSAFMHASVHYFPRFAAIAAGTLAVYAAAATAYGAAAVNVRPALLVVLVLAVGVATLVASYARARIAVDDTNLRAAVESAVRLLRVDPLGVTAHALLALVGWAVLMAGLAWLDRRIGAGTGFWRPLMFAQAYVLARVVLRLVWEASAVSFVRVRQTVSR